MHAVDEADISVEVSVHYPGRSVCSLIGLLYGERGRANCEIKAVTKEWSILFSGIQNKSSNNTKKNQRIDMSDHVENVQNSAEGIVAVSITVKT